MDELDRYPYCMHSVLIEKKSGNGKMLLNMFQAFLKKGLVKREKGMHPILKKTFPWAEDLSWQEAVQYGGWNEVKKMRLSGQDRIKSDQ